MAKVNVGTRNKAEDDAALASLIEKETSTKTKKLVKEGDKQFLVEKTVAGLTVKTRVA